jgi:hypothetical protein
MSYGSSPRNGIVLYQSGQIVVAPNDTNSNALATYTLPPNSMGKNGMVEVVCAFELSASATGSTDYFVQFGPVVGQVCFVASYTYDAITFSSQGVGLRGGFCNSNSLVLNRPVPAYPTNGVGWSQAGSTLNTSLAVPVSAYVSKSVSGDYTALTFFQVVLYPGN